MKEIIFQKLKNSLPKLRKKYPFTTVALFGSIVRDDFNENSDVDILIDYQSDDFIVFNSFAEELEILLGKRIDLDTTRSLKPRQFDYLKNQLIYV